MKKPKAPTRPTNQVRIIGGRFKRRQISFIDTDGLRPTPDRLRETLFNWLMADLLDARVLDVCAGSGVLSFEALSRGASSAVMIEPTAQAFELTKTAQTLGTPHAHIIKDLAQNALLTLDTAFDVIFIDPPYALNLWQPLLDIIIARQLYHADTLIYLESDQPLSNVITTPVHTIKSAKIGQVYAEVVQIA